MLNNVPTQINRSSRLVTLRHPNAMDCTVWKKVLKRTVAEPPEDMGGLPTIGGLGMLDGEDEADYEFVERGDAKIVFTGGQFAGDGANWNDSDTGLIYDDSQKEALIECILDPCDENYFVPGKPDIVSVEPGGGIVLVFEVSGERGNISIPPYSRKFILTARSDSEVGIG